MSSGPAEWREDDHRNVAIGPPRVLGEVREALGPPSELPLALVAGCLPGQDVDRLAPHLDSGVRLCLEVVVPGGVARRHDTPLNSDPTRHLGERWLLASHRDSESRQKRAVKES